MTNIISYIFLCDDACDWSGRRSKSKGGSSKWGGSTFNQTWQTSSPSTLHQHHHMIITIYDNHIINLYSVQCTLYQCTMYRCTSTSKKVPPIREQTIVAYSQVYLQYKANLFPGLLVSISVFYLSFTLKASPRPCENTSSNLLPSIGDHPTSPSRNYRELLEIIPNFIELSVKGCLPNDRFIQNKPIPTKTHNALEIDIDIVINTEI